MLRRNIDLPAGSRAPKAFLPDPAHAGCEPHCRLDKNCIRSCKIALRKRVVWQWECWNSVSNRKERRASRRLEFSGTGPQGRAGATADAIELAALHEAQGRPHEALRLLKQVLAREPDNATAHDLIAATYQALGRRNDAVRHFCKAFSHGLYGLRGGGTLLAQSPTVVAALGHFARAHPLRLTLPELLGDGNAVAADARLLALLQSEVVRDVEIELFVTAIRRELLAARTGEPPAALGDDLFELACALAQQCFLNEYVFDLSDAEREMTARLQDRVAQADAKSAPDDLAVLGCYVPLHQLPGAARLAARSFPKPLDATITLQVREPITEAADTSSIPALTAIEDRTSQQVRQQYEENPYPRWVVPLPAPPTTIDAFLQERFSIAGPAGGDILIAGCGTGEQSVNSAQTFPRSKVLAVDISRTSLAYARRKTRELKIRNIEYAQADILKLGTLDRRFDLIESVGVLHHMADPEAGWRALLPLLRPGGVMRIALYSETGRKTLDAARALIAERNYGPGADDIRRWRRELTERGKEPHSVDFFTISSCRDLCFHVMEHRFTLPRIKRFLEANGLTVLGLETSAETQQRFAQQHPDPGAQTDLDRWDAFERAHPSTFSNMYYLWVRSAVSAGATV